MTPADKGGRPSRWREGGRRLPRGSQLRAGQQVRADHLGGVGEPQVRLTDTKGGAAMAVVLTERRDRALVVTINRPEARNAVNAEVAQLLFEAVEAFKADDALDALILTGAGDIAFCAGADLKGGAGLMSRPGAQESGPMGFSRVTDVRKPTMAAVNGYCLAGGVELACWCDFRVADETSQFGILNRRWGVPLLDGGT